MRSSFKASIIIAGRTAGIKISAFCANWQQLEATPTPCRRFCATIKDQQVSGKVRSGRSLPLLRLASALMLHHKSATLLKGATQPRALCPL